MKQYIELVKVGDKLCLYVNNQMHSRWPATSLNIVLIKAAAFNLYWELIQMYGRELVMLQPYIQGSNIPNEINIDAIEDGLTAHEDWTDRVNVAYNDGVRRVVEEIKNKVQ